MAQDMIPRSDNTTDIGSEEVYLQGLYTERITFADTTYLEAVPSGAGGYISDYAQVDAGGTHLTGKQTNAHGMTSGARWCQCILQCTSPNAGYTLGDKVFFQPQNDESDGIVVWWDDTNLYTRIGNQVSINNFTDGNHINITLSSWKLLVNLFY